MSTFQWIAFAVITILSSARLTRLLTFDHFPPIEWAREKYAARTDGSSWQLLAYCPFCMSFWVTLGVVLWGYYTDWQIWWWLINGIFAASYVAAMVMVRDGEE